MFLVPIWIFCKVFEKEWLTCQVPAVAPIAKRLRRRRKDSGCMKSHIYIYIHYTVPLFVTVLVLGVALRTGVPKHVSDSWCSMRHQYYTCWERHLYRGRWVVVGHWHWDFWSRYASAFAAHKRNAALSFTWISVAGLPATPAFALTSQRGFDDLHRHLHSES